MLWFAPVFTVTRTCVVVYYMNSTGAMSAAANRAVDTVAAGRRVEARGGKRLSRQAWQDIRRACRLAAESERVRAVDIHGGHIFLFCCAFLPWLQ